MIKKPVNSNVLDNPVLLFPQIISLEQKYTHYVLDILDVRSIQHFLLDIRESIKVKEVDERSDIKVQQKKFFL